MNRTPAWLCLALVCLSLPGCGGCVRRWFPSAKAATQVDAEKRRQRAALRPDFVIDGLRTLPHALSDKPKDEPPKPDEDPEPTTLRSTVRSESPIDLLAGDGKTRAGDATIGRLPDKAPTADELAEPGYAFVKPGHWTSATLGVTAYNFNYRGELVTQPVELRYAPFVLGSSRRASLPKGERKHLELTLFVPPGRMDQPLITRLQAGMSGGIAAAQSHLISRMPPHQFFFLVLARDEAAYTYLNDLATFNPAAISEYDGFESRHYRLLQPKIGNRLPLSTNALTWSALAYIVWDQVPPSMFTGEQQQALVDWLHWGGQLIISGPDSLAQLRGTFFDKYLPVDGGENYDLAPDAYAALNVAWTIPETRPLTAQRPWSGQHLLVRAGSETLAQAAGEPLVVERRIGRGRVVVSGFRLAQRELTVWPSFDSFLNNCLLRRGPRVFSTDPDDGSVQMAWEGGLNYFAPEAISRMRYFTRDTGAQPLEDDPENQSLVDSILGPLPDPNVDPGLDDLSRPRKIGPGVAGWDDFNLIGNWARDTLYEASRIEIPDRRFVLITLLAYLAVLVPCNWVVFRLVGRLEWAWIATPLISLAATAIVVRQARLDIGFTRARTEIGVVELHREYRRAHVTRYTSLYTSIGTGYELRFADRSALAQPLGNLQTLMFGQSRQAVSLSRDQEITLTGLSVGSNALGLVHSEHMLDVGGAMSVRTAADGTPEIVNGTSLALEQVEVLANEGRLWIGTLEPGAVARVDFSRPSQRPRDASSGSNARELASKGNQLFEHASEWRGDGGMLLVGLTRNPLAGLQISPAATQTTALNLVVAHLDLGIEPAPRPDQSTAELVQKAEARRYELELPDK